MSDPTSLKVVFAGTPDFAARSLEALLQAGHQVAAVLTQPDRPAGRGRRLMASPVKTLAQAHALPVLQPDTLRDPDIQSELMRIAPDVMVVVAYGLIVPPAVLALPRHGCINVHASLLPRWRGAAPIQRAIEAGDTETGVGIMQMEKGLDTGPVLLEVRTPIAPDETGGSLHDRLAAMGAEALVRALADLPALLAGARVQPDTGVTYAHKLQREDARLDWGLPAVRLADRVRAFNPWPVAWTALAGDAVKVWRARAVSGPVTGAAPGTILDVSDDGVRVACGEGVLLVEEIQLPGKRAMPVADLLRGRQDFLRPGQVFDAG